MGRARSTCAVAVLCGCLFAAAHEPTLPQVNHFEIGRHTFIDTGPPFDFYEIFIVQTTANGTLIERLTLTPPGAPCLVPAQAETATATSSDSVATLLGGRNPCTIPEKALNEEMKRRKKGPVFSGADVALRVQCGNGDRLIRADILDRDMFDAAPSTPENTSWTMRLLARLDQAIGGPGVLDKPIFSVPGKEDTPRKNLDPKTIERLSAGYYDGLFADAPDKPFDIYRAAQIRIPPPTVQVMSVAGVTPTVSPLPDYPPVARLASIEGTVSFKVKIDENGNATDLIFESGHPILQSAVKGAVSRWKFPLTAAHQQVQATIEFALNCREAKK